MSLYDYEVGRDLERQDFPFYALIQAAMRRASSDNSERLQTAFPAVWEELQARYHASAGCLTQEELDGVLRRDLAPAEEPNSPAAQ